MKSILSKNIRVNRLGKKKKKNKKNHNEIEAEESELKQNTTFVKVDESSEE